MIWKLRILHKLIMYDSNTLTDVLKTECDFFILNYISSPLQSKAMFKSEFYISNLASAFMSTDTFSSTDPITKNTKEENYKDHNKID